MDELTNLDIIPEETVPVEEMDELEETNEEALEPEDGSDEPQEVPPAKSKSNNVPLDKYMHERKRRQELERILSQQREESAKLDEYQKLLKIGYPEPEAMRLAEKEVHARRETEEIKSKLLDAEIRDLARNDDFYADAESFKEDIKEKMRSHGIPADEAYLLIRGKARMREVQVQREQREIAQKKTTPAKKPASSAPSAPKNPYPMTDEEKTILKRLQEMQPEAGWTSEKFHKTMKN